MIGQGQPEEGSKTTDATCHNQHCGKIDCPVPGRCGRQHHQSYRHQSAQGLEPGHQVDDHESDEQDVNQRAAKPMRPQEMRIDRFHHQRPVADGQVRLLGWSRRCRAS